MQEQQMREGNFNLTKCGAVLLTHTNAIKP